MLYFNIKQATRQSIDDDSIHHKIVTRHGKFHPDSLPYLLPNDLRPEVREQDAAMRCELLEEATSLYKSAQEAETD